MKKVSMALIVAQPGSLRNSLQTLLTTLPSIEIIAETRDMSTLLRMGNSFQPDLVLIETNAGNNLFVVVQQIKKAWLNTRCVVLVDSKEQKETAIAAGADLTLFKGCRATDLINQIEGLLVEKTAVS